MQFNLIVTNYMENIYTMNIMPQFPVLEWRPFPALFQIQGQDMESEGRLLYHQSAGPMYGSNLWN